MLRAGTRFQVVRPAKVGVMTSWYAPFTGGHDAVVPEGEILEVENDQVRGASAVYLRPDRYDELHATFVAEHDRQDSRYAGYLLIMDIQEIERCCVRLSE